MKTGITRMHPTDAQKAQAIKMYNDGNGVPASEIAGLIGCSASWVWKVALEAKREREAPPAPTPPSFVSQAKTQAQLDAEAHPNGPTWEDFATLRERVAVLESKLAPLL